MFLVEETEEDAEDEDEGEAAEGEGSAATREDEADPAPAEADMGVELLAFGLARWGRSLPRLPEGDVVVALDAVTRAAGPVSAVFGRLDAVLRRWPAAAMSLLSIALLFGVAIVGGR